MFQVCASFQRDPRAEPAIAKKQKRAWTAPVMIPPLFVMQLVLAAAEETAETDGAQRLRWTDSMQKQPWSQSWRWSSVMHRLREEYWFRPQFLRRCRKSPTVAVHT